ncbi:MAG: MarR family transcriptional regulator [Clostridiaceae bacterium]|nr:MarR family transcriptional regulator [Clostridiaceae bacterium]
MEQESQRAVQFMRALRRMEFNFHRFGPPGGLARGSFEVLMAIHMYGMHSGSPLRIGELSDHMKRPLPAISRWASELEQRGLLRRFTGDDRRTVCVELTAEGLDLMEQGKKRMIAMVETMLSRLGTEDGDQLVSLMERASGLVPEINGEKKQ